MPEIISVRFREEGKQYYFDPQILICRPGDGVIVETASGREYAQVFRGNFFQAETELKAPLRKVVRIATLEDKAKVQRNREREKRAYRICQEKIAEHGLPMKLVSAEYNFENTKLLFFFTSEGRVDFRALVRTLASIFRVRIELRQIGIRDEAKLLGGIGICGRPFCCSVFLRDFQPVSIKMAKSQNLSLNPVKISGTCGRLMCCLKYEQAAYEDLLKDAPRADSFVETPDGIGDIASVNLLRERVRVRLDDAPEVLHTYRNSEIRVIRSGKGRRPEDYVAPPKSELAKLRQDSPDPGEEKARLVAALDEFLSEDEGREASAEPENEHRRHRSRGKGGERRRRERETLPELQEPDGLSPSIQAYADSMEEQFQGEEAPTRRRSSRRSRSRGHGRKPGSAASQNQSFPAGAQPAREKRRRPPTRRRRSGSGQGTPPPQE